MGPWDPCVPIGKASPKGGLAERTCPAVSRTLWCLAEVLLSSSVLLPNIVQSFTTEPFGQNWPNGSAEGYGSVRLGSRPGSAELWVRLGSVRPILGSVEH